MQHPHRNKIDWDPDEDTTDTGEDEGLHGEFDEEQGPVDIEPDEGELRRLAYQQKATYDPFERQERKSSEKVQKWREMNAYKEQKAQDLRDLVSTDDPRVKLEEEGWKRVEVGPVKDKEGKKILEGEQRPRKVRKVPKSSHSDETAQVREWEGTEPEPGKHYVWENQNLPGFQVVEGYSMEDKYGDPTFYIKRPSPEKPPRESVWNKKKGKWENIKPVLPEHPGGYTVEDLYKWSHESDDGESQEVSPTTSWRRTHQFNKDQNRRARASVKEGNYYRGYNLWEGNKGVDVKRVPQEKSDIGIGANKEYVFHTGEWERTDQPTKVYDELTGTWLDKPPRTVNTKLVDASIRESKEGTKSKQHPKKYELKDIPYKKGEEMDPKLRTLLQRPPKRAQQSTGPVNSSITVMLSKKPDAIDEEQQKQRATGPVLTDVEGNPILDKDRIPVRGQEVIDEGQDLRSVIEKAGLKNIAEITPDENNPKLVKIVTTTGTHINPQQAAAVRKALRETYGISKGESGNELFGVQAPPMRQKIVRTPYGASKSELSEPAMEDAYTDVVPLYDKTLNAHIGQRNDRGELLTDEKGEPIEKDTLAIRVPAGKLGKWAYGDRVAYMNFQDRTDAIGWGKDWRPGEKEVGSFLTAVPRERDQENLHRAVQAHYAGDSSRLDEYIRDKDPDIDESQMEQMRTELGALSGALGASAYYTARKRGKSSFINSGTRKAINVAHKIPGVEKFDTDHRLTAKFIEAHDAASLYKFKAGEKYERASWRLAHPLRDPDAPENVGVSIRNLYPPTPGGRLRYRQIGIHPEKFEARKLERDRRHLEKQVSTRTKIKQDIDELESGKTTRNPIKRLDRRFSLRAAQQIINTDKPRENRTSPLVERVGKLRVDSKKIIERGPVSSEPGKLRSWLEERTPLTHHDYSETAQQEGYKSFGSSKEMQRKLKEADLSESADFVKARNLKGLNNPLIPKKAKLAVGGAALVGGAAIFAYDAHKTHKLDKGEESKHRLMNHIPEVIYTPKLSGRITHEYPIPNNAFTSALDIEGKKVPYDWKIGVVKKEHRLRNFKDVSKEPYRQGPLIGVPKLGSPSPNTGSLAKGIVYQRPSDVPGPKNQYGADRPPTILVKGHDTGVTLDLGKKERWQDKNHKRNLKSTVKSLDKEEKEHMKKRKERWKREMDQERIEYENTRLAAKVGVGAGLTSRTTEEYETERRAQSRADRDYRRREPFEKSS